MHFSQNEAAIILFSVLWFLQAFIYCVYFLFNEKIATAMCDEEIVVTPIPPDQKLACRWKCGPEAKWFIEYIKPDTNRVRALCPLCFSIYLHGFMSRNEAAAFRLRSKDKKDIEEPDLQPTLLEQDV